jgi:uncharacterized protein YkwD
MIFAFARAACAALLVLALAACGGGGGLPLGLTQRMDSPGAQLDRAQAFAMINQYRSTVGVAPLANDPSLDAAALQAAMAYAKTGRQTPKPAGTIQIRYSAGYATFAETFSGWRGSPQDSAAMTDRSATRAGIAVTYEANSPYGVYWVIIVG